MSFSNKKPIKLSNIYKSSISIPNTLTIRYFKFFVEHPELMKQSFEQMKLDLLSKNFKNVYEKVVILWGDLRL